MQDEEGGAGAPRSDVHRATVLLRSIVELSEAFEHGLGRDLGVNPTDLSAMEHLIQSGPLTPSDLAKRLSLTPAAATTVVDRLVSVGHVERRPHPTDRRGILVVPAPASVARALSTVMPMVGDINAVVAEFSEEERRIFTRFLERVVETYGEHVDRLAARVPDPL